MRRADGVFALVDYGLSRHQLLPDLLAEDSSIGTGPYLSPEQIAGDRSDPRSDIFALGVVLYYLLTGARPFGYPRRRRTLRRRLWRDPTPPRALNAACPPWLQEVILRCLEPNAGKRYPSAAQLAFDLAHPEQIELGRRAAKMRADGFFTARARWWRMIIRKPGARGGKAARPAAAPIVMAAVDLSEGAEQLAETLREATARAMRTAPEARLACVNVMRSSRLAINYALDEQGRNIHVRRLVELRQWARPLKLAPEQLTVHVLESADPGAALLDFASSNRVDQILIGARAPTNPRAQLGASPPRSPPAPCAASRWPARRRRPGPKAPRAKRMRPSRPRASAPSSSCAHMSGARKPRRRSFSFLLPACGNQAENRGRWSLASLLPVYGEKVRMRGKALAPMIPARPRNCTTSTTLRLLSPAPHPRPLPA